MTRNDAPAKRPIDRGQVYLVVLLITAIASLLAGFVTMAYVARDLPAQSLRQHARHILANWPMLLPLLAIALTVLIGRFIRWHFLLRSLNTRAPLGTSLLAYYAGVPMVLTPGYVGELISAFVLNRLGGGSVFRGVSALITGRVHDVLAIFILLSLHSRVHEGLVLAGVIVGLALLGWLSSPLWTAGLDAVFRQLRRIPFLRWLVPGSAVDAAMLLAPGCFIPTLLVSVAGWYLISIVLVLAVSVAGYQPDVQGCSRIFLEGTLYGAKHLSPAGIGYTSHYMWHNLVRQLGVPDTVALEAATLTRFTVTGLTILVGFAAFFFVFNRHRRLLSAADRFDALSTRYDEELATYVLDRLLERKTERMLRCLDPQGAGAPSLTGADIGCGTGGYAARMAERCGRMIAMDAAEGQVRQASARRRTNSAFLAAQLPRLPLADESVDFAYAINVFHHLPDRDVQARAFAEVSRVLKPGGLFFIHEINTINPLFRFYMGYIFPVLHQLDDGSELWLTPDDVEDLTDMRVELGEYFTFLPEFTPQLWQTTLGFLERWLEQSRLRRYSAHYMLMCRKT
ncbi:MAG: methyltransferase domain-containing protein [Phycisphaerae bacterium]|nr:methyltransferase domain-containing protein [Phycisphaerae bacterium]